MDQIRDSDNHAAPRIIGKQLEAKTAIERADSLIERMRQHSETADMLGELRRRGQREIRQRSSSPFPLC